MKIDKFKVYLIKIISLLSLILLVFNKVFVGESIVLLLFLAIPMFGKEDINNFKFSKTQKIQILSMYVLLYLRAIYQNGSFIRTFNKLYRYPICLVLLILSFPYVNKIVRNLYNEFEKIRKREKSYIQYMFLTVFLIEIVPLFITLFLKDKTLVTQITGIFRFAFSLIIIEFLIYRVLNEKNIFIYLSLLIVALMFIATIVNIHIAGSYIFYYNYAWLYYAIFNVGFLPYYIVFLKDNYYKQSMMILKIGTILWSLYVFLILLRVYTPLEESWLNGIGFNSNGYLYARATPPILSYRLFAFIMIICLIIFHEKSKLGKVIWHMPLIINLVLLYLSNEKTPIYALFILILLSGILAYYNKHKIKYIFLTLLILLSVIGLRNVTFNLLHYSKSNLYLDFIDGKYNGLDENFNLIYVVNNDDIEVNARGGLGEGFFIRLSYWYNAAKNITKYPKTMFFGCMETELSDTLNLLGAKDAHAHNEFVNLLVSRGILVTLAFLVYCCYALYFGIKKAIKSKDLKTGAYTVICFCLILLFMMDSGLLTGSDIFQILFFSLVGLILNEKVDEIGIHGEKY